MKLVLTLEEAERYGLIGCACGHPQNNHFDFSKTETPCAHCKCKSFQLRARVGKLTSKPDRLSPEDVKALVSIRELKASAEDLGDDLSGYHVHRVLEAADDVLAQLIEES